MYSQFIINSSPANLCIGAVVCLYNRWRAAWGGGAENTAQVLHTLVKKTVTNTPRSSHYGCQKPNGHIQRSQQTQVGWFAGMAATAVWEVARFLFLLAASTQKPRMMSAAHLCIGLSAAAEGKENRIVSSCSTAVIC